MSVLTKLVQERQEWADLHKVQEVRRNRFMFVEYIILGALVLGIAMHYEKILGALSLVGH